MNSPTSEENEKARTEVVRAAEHHLEADGLVIANLILVTVRFVPKGDPFAARDRDTWYVFFQSRDADPDFHPNAIPVEVDDATRQTRRIGLL